MTVRCVECKKLPAIYWDKSFCVDCYGKILKSETKLRSVEKCQKTLLHLQNR